MGSQMAKSTNKKMVDSLVKDNYVTSANVEGAFRAVDRAMYFEIEDDETTDPYDEDPWRRGNLHLSAPCIYAKVVEALDLHPGLSFLNLGSGTGYLNTIVGLLVGPNGPNHGIEFHSDVVDYAYKRLQEFKLQSYAIDKFEFSEPIFIQGNCINLNPDIRYDRIYLGAACLPELELFIKRLVKLDGGVLVMPFEGSLMRYQRISETDWESEKLMNVTFTPMIRQIDDAQVPMINMPFAKLKSLKELCRSSIRQGLREKVNSINPKLLYYDNSKARQARKDRAKAFRNERRHLPMSNRSRPPGRKYIGCTCGKARAIINRSPSEQTISSTNATVAELSPSNSVITTRSVSRRSSTAQPQPQPPSPLPPLASTKAASNSNKPQKSEDMGSSSFCEPSSSRHLSPLENDLDLSDRCDSEISLDGTLATSDDEESRRLDCNDSSCDEPLCFCRRRTFEYPIGKRSSLSSAHFSHCILHSQDRLISPPVVRRSATGRIIDIPTSPSRSTPSDSPLSTTPDLSDASISSFYDITGSRTEGEHERFRSPSWIFIQNQLDSANVNDPASSSESESCSESDEDYRRIFGQGQSPPLQPLLQSRFLNQIRLDCKRKRQSSSESSGTSNPTSPIRRSQPSSRIGIDECTCTQLKLNGTGKMVREEMSNTDTGSHEKSSGGERTAYTLQPPSSEASLCPSNHLHLNSKHRQRDLRQLNTASTTTIQSHSKQDSNQSSRFSAGPSSAQVHSHHPIPSLSTDNFVSDPTARCCSERNSDPTSNSFWQPLPCARRKADFNLLFRTDPRGYYSRNPGIARGQAEEALRRAEEKVKQRSEYRREERRKKYTEKCKRRTRRREEGRSNECKRYYSHISGYIRQLPLPRTLHSYLNYERNW